MRRSRIFCKHSLQVGEAVVLEQRNIHYLLNVLRVKPGQSLILFDGSGQDFLAIVDSVTRKQLTIKIQATVEQQNVLPESPLWSTLAIAVSKGERMDQVIQKSVELGVSEIQPLISKRVSIKLNAEHLQKKVEHWQAVAQSACEQSGRSIVPMVHSVVLLENWLDALSKGPVKDDTINLTLKPGAESVSMLAKRMTTSVARVRILIGPEGGLDETEIVQAEKVSFVPVGFGSRVLRTETAPIVALTIAQLYWGDF